MLSMILLLALKIFPRSNNDDGTQSEDNNNDEATTEAEAESLPPVIRFDKRGANGWGLSEPLISYPTTDSSSYAWMPWY